MSAVLKLWTKKGTDMDGKDAELLEATNYGFDAARDQYEQDAKRYRWLRERFKGPQSFGPEYVMAILKLPGETIDEVIDKAIANEYREAIGCAPAIPGSISPEEAIRRGRE